jgi:hypothetical protein
MEATTTALASGAAAAFLLLFFSFLCSSLAMAAAAVGGWEEEASATWRGTKSIRRRRLGFGPRGLYAAAERVVGSRVYGEVRLDDVWAPDFRSDKILFTILLWLTRGNGRRVFPV